MASVTPGYTFTGATDPITYTKLNLLAQPTVALGSAEVVSANLATSLSMTNVTLSGKLITTPDSRSGAGAVSVTTVSTELTTTGADALTLADGTAGQIKIITMITDGGDGTLTPSTKTGFSTVTFNDVGDTIVLQFHTTKGWMVVSNYGCTIA